MQDRREPQVWMAQEAAHHARVDALTASARERARTGVVHPVEDFLFTYYRHKPGRLRRWHPGPGVVLLAERDGRSGVPDETETHESDRTGARLDTSGRGGAPHAQWRHYRSDGEGTWLDVNSFLHQRGATVQFVHDLLAATASRAPSLRCFGLHEWAMVHGQSPADVRHAAWPLRLTRAETDAVAQSLPIRCTHFDAYRFFTPSGAALARLTPTRETQIELEQPGCLHATMDLYKWAFKLGPGICSDLVVEALRLAWRAREVDMRAAPYDLSELGYDPIPVETAQGRATYVEHQRELAVEGAVLRSRIIEACRALLGSPAPGRPPG